MPVFTVHEYRSVSVNELPNKLMLHEATRYSNTVKGRVTVECLIRDIDFVLIIRRSTTRKKRRKRRERYYCMKESLS